PDDDPRLLFIDKLNRILLSQNSGAGGRMNVVVLRRRLFYICAMVLLLVPLYFLGNPSVRNPDGSVKQAGGTLAQIRTNYDLGQGDLGEIDPASESMRLATLGLRGVAATILWQKAEYYKREQFWDRLSATLNQIAVLQPHFVEVWEFQAHNLSYNVSVEFDDYRQRYQWVKRGIEYLIKGSKFNKHRTEMPFEMGNFFGSKMGVADERLQFRSLYRNDNNFHEEVLDKTGLDVTQTDGLGADRKPDNWLSGRLWFDRAYAMVDAGSAPAKSALMFYVKGPQWFMKSAEAMQAEGTLDEPARYAWRRAGRDLEAFGKRNIVTSYGDTIYLKETAIARENYDKLNKEFQELTGETYEKVLAERKASLTPKELAAWEKPELDRTIDEMIDASKVEYVLTIPPDEVARALPEEYRVAGYEKAHQLSVARDKIQHIETYANQVNFAYWEARCEAEQDDAAILARTSMYEANQLLDRGELDAAIAKYDEAWKAWGDLFNKFPAMMIDDAADEVTASIARYRRLLDQPDLPEDFALKDFVRFRELHDASQTDPAIMQVMSVWPMRYPDRNFLTELFRKIDEQAATTSDVATPEETTPGSTNEVSESAPEAASAEEPPKPTTVESPATVELSIAPPDEGSAPRPTK
ncbi:MAG: hypothetical protein ABI557_06875, partial [Aureliella sp.]